MSLLHRCNHSLWVCLFMYVYFMYISSIISLCLYYTGVTAEEFVTRPLSSNPNIKYGRSQYDILREYIANKLGVPTKNVDIFTIMNHATLVRTIDIRYSAHGSPYYKPVKLDGIISASTAKVLISSGFRIISPSTAKVLICSGFRIVSPSTAKVLISSGFRIISPSTSQGND